MKSKIHHLVLTVGLSLICHGQPNNRSPQRPDLLARVHFAGFQQINASTNATTLREVWEMPISVEVREQAIQKIARRLAELQSPGAIKEAMELLRPLLDDLWRKESYLELRAQPNGDLGWVLAVKLDTDRARVWQANWTKWSSQWETKKTFGTFHLLPTKTNSWIVMNSGATRVQDFRLPNDNDQLVEGGKNSLFQLRADLPRLAKHFSFGGLTTLPTIELAVTGKGATLRSHSQLTFSEPVVRSLESWQIPTNTIRDPVNSLISFTAIQGIAPWLSKQPLVKDLSLPSVPNQAYFWGQSHAPFQVLAALQLPNVTNAMQKLASQWIPRANSNLTHYGVGELQTSTNRAQIAWTGLPFILPYLRPAPEPGGNFAVAGVLPIPASTNPPPAGLLNQLTSRTNLVYYDWEITQGRVAQLRPLAQWLSMFTTIPPTDTNSLSSRWLESIEPKLGNTVTEISVSSPKNLSLVRNSHVGLNGLELVALAYWLEGTNFPRLNYRISFPEPKAPRKP